MKKSQISKNSSMDNHEPGEVKESKEIIFHIPPGVRFDDIYIDLQEVCIQLKKCKRIIGNLRRKGILSYTTLHNGKIYFLKQEIAAILKANLVIGENSITSKEGLQHFITFIMLNLFWW